MLNQPTIEKLQVMKLHGMANAFQEQIESAEINQLSFEERFGLLVDRQWTWKESRALTRRLQLAKFKERAVIEDINYQHKRGLDRKLMRTLSSSEWVRQQHGALFIGPTGIGKTWLACALAHKACRDGFFALHKGMAELFRDLATARADGTIGQLLLKLARVDVLLLDDFAMAPMKDHERRDFLEICDDRYQRRSTILTSQLPIANWHEQIGDPSIVDSIIAAAWQRSGIALECVERAILLGCLRKYATLINHGSGTPITTLGYFRSLIDEIDQLNASPDYWQYVTIRLADLERRWRKQHNRPPRGHEPEKTK